MTRRRLLRAAEKLFVTHGFDAVSVDRIVAAAAVTKGAFYHHFADKLGIFREVFESIDREMGEIVRARALTADTPLGMVQLGARTCFELCTRPRYGRMVYVVAPAALGWAAWHETDTAIARQIVVEGLQNAVDRRELAPASLSALATLLLGAILQAAITIATSPRPKRVAAELAAETDRLLLALAAQAGYRPRELDPES
ncbi:TetR/AcrR family transcriptional regulator [Sinimarinibacterium flocculans]|uniref:TetR family transcriptional regulator n=1 Tax=Sinimarinibacterium flocculans TaxID=985250 RepID=A0A318E757_9GAMM|nr:TetR/AcrR family transcriptional regulator [Sinimarinibacterium flocculans]PXV64888.1 TetR family transcriptional regulator [Sinimarinibacterium flocculans]